MASLTSAVISIVLFLNGVAWLHDTLNPNPLCESESRNPKGLLCSFGSSFSRCWRPATIARQGQRLLEGALSSWAGSLGVWVFPFLGWFGFRV